MTTETAQPPHYPSPRRRLRLRVTTGCKTCRRRHVKCDETKPTCLNCGKKNRQCEYDRLQSDDGTESHTRQLPIAATPASPVAIENEDEDGDEDFPINRTLDDDYDDAGEEAPQGSLAECSPHSPFSATLESVLLQARVGPIQDQNDRVEQGGYTTLGPRDHLHHGSQLQLAESEIVIFRNYVENISKWVDSFSHDQPFHRLVPVLALQNPFLLHSCLALSSKQMALVGSGVHESTAVRYYRLALRAIRSLLVDPQYAHSDEVLAACIILSTYEMIDVVGESIGSHLKGVASLLHSRQITGELFGIKGSCYWTWYRHEIWASLQTGRRMSLDEHFWKPPALETFDGLSIENISNRAIFIFGQCINFCNDDRLTTLSGGQLAQAQSDKVEELACALEEWKSKLPMSMSSFATEYSEANGTSAFPSIWFIFPQSAIAHQVYYASKVILALHSPPSAPTAGGLGNLASLSLRRHIESCREQIFLTANAGIPDAWSLVSAQCLYIAGLVTDGVQERRRTLELIDLCQQRTGRKTSFIADELRRLWQFPIATKY